MKNKSLRLKNHGFAVIGVVIALTILGVMAAGLAVLTASNQSSRVSQGYTSQGYYISHAAFEYSMRSILADGDSVIPQRQILGSELGASLASNKISSTTTYGSIMSASNSFSVSQPASGPSCTYVLASSGSGALSFVGSGALSSPSCGININSSSSSALSIVGSAPVNSYFVKIVGGYSIVGTGTITTHSGSVQTGVTAVPDPMLAYNMPTYSACTYTNMSILSNTTLSPGVYCGGISIVGSPTVTLNPGQYILDGGSFSSTGSAIITGSGVTIFLNKQIKSTYATFNLTMSGGSVTLTAPTSAQDPIYAGIVIFQSRNAPSGSDSIVGTTALSISGAVYFPNQTLTYVGGSSASAPCTMLVANKISVTGSANINCSSGALSGLIH